MDCAARIALHLRQCFRHVQHPIRDVEFVRTFCATDLQRVPRGFEAIMIRKLLTVLLLLLPAVPALARSNPDYYPIPCDVLWTAVMSTLNNPSNYSVIVSDDLNRRASFVVIGDLTVYRDVVTLKSQDKGCIARLNITQVGSDNSNERSFRGRLKRTLARMQRPKPPLAIGAGLSTASAAGPPAPAPPAPAPGAPGKPQIAPRTGPDAIWASTLTSQIVFTPAAASRPDDQRSGGKPASAIASAVPSGY